MAKAALPSLAASLLLHGALSLGASVQALRVSRAPLVASRPAELELVPVDAAPPAQLPLGAPAAERTELAPVAERAAPPRRSDARERTASVAAGTVLPVALPLEVSSTEPPSGAEPSVAEPSVAEPSVAPPSVVEPSAAESSAAPPNGAPESSGTAAGALASSGAAARASASASGGANAGTGRPAAGSGDADRAVRAAYLQELRRRVLGHRVYPYLARRARLEGTVCLRVSLNGQGQVAQLQATCAAPAPLLEAAFSAVRTAAPFGPLPSQLGGALTVDIPVVFQLEAL